VINNEKKGKNTWLYVAILLCLLLGFEKCHYQKEVEDQFNLIVTLEQQKTNFEVKIDELGAQSARQEVLLIDAQRGYEILLADFKDLDKTKSQTKVITKTSIDSVFIPIVSVDTIWIDKQKFPVYSFQDSTEFYFISGRVSPKEAFLKQISFTNNITFSQTWERKNFLAKKTYFVEVKNTNPFVTIQGVQNYEIKENTRFWEQGKFWFAVGTGVGILINK
jgi:hypothetical protein